MWPVILGFSFLLQAASAVLFVYSANNKNWEVWNQTLTLIPATWGQIATAVSICVTLLFLLHIMFNRQMNIGRKVVWLIICLLIPLFGNFGYWKTIATGEDAFMVPMGPAEERPDEHSKQQKETE